MSSQHLFAPGHDNQGGLVGLHELLPPLFKLYRADGPLAAWQSQVERVLDGSRQLRRVGLPLVTFTFQVITPAEAALLHSTFYAGDPYGLDADVTIQTYDADLGTWLPYNGTLRWPERFSSGPPRLGSWDAVDLVVDDLVRITGFSSGFDPLAFGA